MKKLLKFQLILTFSALTFSIYTIFNDFYSYYNICGSILPVISTLTHPFYTPCFYGGFAFLICFVLSTYVLTKRSIKIQRYLLAFSIFGVAFAYSNMVLEVKKYLEAGFSTYKGCSGATVNNPFFTPCFFGSVFFTLIMLISFITLYKMKKQK